MYSTVSETVECFDNYYYNSARIYFKTQELLNQAIDIIGEDNIKEYLTNNY